MEHLVKVASSARVIYLQGDVACGKTVVAFLAMFAAVGSGFQAALMAPSQASTLTSSTRRNYLF